MKESQAHKAFAAYLDHEKIPFVHSRTDKRHTNAVGDPDFFVLLAGRVLAIEFKVGSNKLSEAQTKRIEYLRRAGISVKILTSVEQAVSVVQTWLGVESEPSVPEAAKSDSATRISAVTDPFILRFQGQNAVFIGDPRPGGEVQRIRTATPADLINIPRR